MTAPIRSLAASTRLADRVRRRSELPIAFGFDLEPDPRTFARDDPPPWRGFEILVERLPALRQRLVDLTGAPVAFTWFLRMDAQVEETWGDAGWMAPTYREELDEITAAGDELGLHTHTWRWEDGMWIADYVDIEWTVHCVALGLDAYEEAFGRPCRAYRGGDYYLNAEIVGHLQARGVTSEWSLEPGRRPVPPPCGDPARGTLPDYTKIPAVPYRSSPDRFPAPDPTSTGPLLVPVYSTPGRHGGRWPLSPELSPARFVLRLAAGLVKATPPVIALTGRTDAPLNERWDHLVHNLEHLARHRGARFITASAAVDRLDGETAQQTATRA